MQSPRLDADIVVCVHDARKHVRRCLAAIVRHSPSFGRLILIDDASKAPCRDELAEFAAAQPRVTLIRNSRRQGYTRSANLGLRQARAGFVVLLNSDTIVTPYWLERLLECAARDSKIGIVGPLSNAATFQSVPERHDAQGGWAHNSLPPGWTPDAVAAAVAAIAPRAFPRVGMLNGFCFGMTRQVIDAIGDFDEEAFPDGYGEEQDYCLRATKAGFDLAVADHAYVYHAGTRSYDPAKREKLKRASRAAQLRKHTSARIRAAISSTYQEPTLRLMRETLAAVLLAGPPSSTVGNSEDPIASGEIRSPARGTPRDAHGHAKRAPSAHAGPGETRTMVEQQITDSARQNPLVWTFMGELDTQCANAELAYTAFVLALGERDASGSQGRAQQRKVFFYVHAFLSHAAMAAAILWPPPEPRGNDDGLDQGLADAMEVVRKERGKQLRKALGGEVKGLKALRRSDFLGRYDDRIDAWSIATASEGVVDMAIGPPADLAGQTSRRAMRQLDPITLTYVYLDQQFDLPAIAAVLSWTHRAVARWVADQVRP